MAHVIVVRHRIVAFCGACGWVRHRISMGPKQGLLLHMGEGNSLAYLPTCAIESQNYVAHMAIDRKFCGSPFLAL
jgi:hypothetical protein